jgi:hypothetical protein
MTNLNLAQEMYKVSMKYHIKRKEAVSGRMLDQ